MIESREAIQKSKNPPVTVTKSSIGEPDESTRTNQVTTEDYATAFTTLGALDPLYDPEMLALLFEHSNSLRQNVDSYAVNIDGFGHRFDPFFDPESPDMNQRIGDAMFTDRQRAVDEAGTGQDAAYPTDEEIKAKRDEITRLMRYEKIKLQHFFEFCSPHTSFVTLRRWTRQDLETMGNAYWEVLRNRGGQVVQFVYVPAFTVRLMPLDMTLTTMKSKVRVSELSYDDVSTTQRLRRFAQIVEGRAVFFKQLGDPRVISAESGVAYNTVEEMLEKEPNVRPATELLHFKIHSSRSSYGVPRWIGNLLAVIGSRQAEEVNFNYFENKSVPPLAVLVSGGRMSEGSVERVQNYIEANVKGKRNFHKILILEAESAGTDTKDSATSRMKIDIKPLAAAQHNDALFQNYDERNIDKVGMSFRLPRMLRGDIRDFNKASADAALTFAEMQVFEPERQEFDFIINRKVLSFLGIRFWRFVSLAPVLRDPEAMSNIIKNVMNASVLTPREARELLGDVFNKQFARLNAAWTKIPPALMIAGVQPEDEPPVDQDPKAPKSPTTSTDWGDADSPTPNREPPEGIEARAELRKYANRSKRTIAQLIKLREELGLREHSEWLAWVRAENAKVA